MCAPASRLGPGFLPGRRPGATWAKVGAERAPGGRGCGALLSSVHGPLLPRRGKQKAVRPPRYPSGPGIGQQHVSSRGTPEGGSETTPPSNRSVQRGRSPLRTDYRPETLLPSGSGAFVSFERGP